MQTASEASAFDARSIQELGVPQPVLMENAGRAAALVLRRLFGEASVLGVVGAGNNGGDALVALRSLQGWGHDVRAILVADRPVDEPLLHGWPVSVSTDSDLTDSEWAHALGSADVVIDGILGTGAQGAPRQRQATAIERINDAGKPVLALDVPSGIDASTGHVEGVAIRADATVSFGAPKVGAMLHPARPNVGRHITVEIGFPPLGSDDATSFAVTPEWARARLPVRETDTHKNRVGRVLIVGGGLGMAGAVILAARAAFHAGAGLVRVCAAEGNREAVQSAIPEAIFLGLEDDGAIADAIGSSDAVAVGPGLGTNEVARRALGLVADAGSTPLLLDADALNLVAAGEIDLADVSARRPVLITPHPGEMSRLLDSELVEGERIPTAVAAAGRLGCSVLFKGAPSVVATPDEPVAVDTQSSSDLAVAGMGDTLTGACVALMGQGLPPSEAGSVGLYLSGRAASLAGRGAGLTPSDVVEWLPAALTESTPSSSDLDLPFVLFDADPAR